MKRLLLFMTICCFTTTAAWSQDVLNEIVKTSLAITNDTTLSKEVRKAAVFKYDAMTYLRSKVLPPMSCWSKRLVQTRSTHASRCSTNRHTP